jgi:membrane protein
MMESHTGDQAKTNPAAPQANDPSTTAPVEAATTGHTAVAKGKIDDLRAHGASMYPHADTRSHGRLSVFRTAAANFMAARATSSAAAISYYALLSLFPIIVFAVLLVGAFFGQPRVIGIIEVFVTSVFPVGREFLLGFLGQSVPVSTSITLFSALMLLWSASSFFVEMSTHVGQAWEPLGARVNTMRERGLGIFTVIAMMVLLAITVVASVVLSMMPQLPTLIPGLRDSLGAILGPILGWVLFLVLIWAVLYGLYRVASGIHVWRTAALLASGLAALVWQIMSQIFGWWAAGDLAHYQHIYGSLTTVILMMLWMYLSAIIVLAGAHLCAAIESHYGPAAQVVSARGAAQ